MKSTVNELLVLKNALQQRRNEIQSLTRSCVRRSVNEVQYGESKETRIHIDESRYDPNDLEERNSELSVAIFEIDRTIKVANAKTKVEVSGLDVKALLSPVKPRPWTPSE